MFSYRTYFSYNLLGLLLLLLSCFQSCPTLSDPMDCSPPGSSVHGVFQAKEYWSGVPLPSPLIGLFSDYYLFPFFLYIFVSVSIVCV